MRARGHRRPPPRVGWVREIARKDEDSLIEAEFDPETGIVTVYEGRREFRELERAARRAGYTKQRVRRVRPVPDARGRGRRERRLLRGPPSGSSHAASRGASGRPRRVRRRGSPGSASLRHRAHHKLMQAFLEPEVFEGAVTLQRAQSTRRNKQLRLVDGELATDIAQKLMLLCADDVRRPKTRIA